MVAFDDLPEALTIDPFFTVAAQPTYEIGQLPIEIIVRRSSARPAVTSPRTANRRKT